MQMRAKQERVIEAVRQGLEGDAAVEFVCRCGYAMSTPAIARMVRLMGGRLRIQQMIDDGKSNIEVLQACFPGELLGLPPRPPSQQDLFAPTPGQDAPDGFAGEEGFPLYDTAKLTLRIPTDLYEALRIAARFEKKTQNQLITEILTSALSRMPVMDDEHGPTPADTER